MPPQEPNGLLLFGLCFLGALGLVGLLKLNHWWATRGRPKSENDLQEEAPEEEETRGAPPVDARIMSRTSALGLSKETAGNSVAGNAPAAGQGVAKPGNGVNDGLPGNTLPEEVREIMRFQAKIEAAEAIIKTGKLGQTEAIESVFECKRSGRPDSAYGRAVAAIKARSDAAYRANQDRLAELVATTETGQGES